LRIESVKQIKMNHFRGDRRKKSPTMATSRVIFARELTSWFSKLVHRRHFRFEKAVNNLRSQNENSIV